jgi:DNA repair photolyase
MTKIGITERGDAALDHGWLPWVKDDRPAILITKDPLKLFDFLTCNDYRFFNIIVHAVVTGFGGTILEPKVPGSAIGIAGFHALNSFLEPGRVVLRVDPVIPTEKGIETARHVIDKCLAERVRISFIDNYDHVKARLKEVDASLPWDSFHAPLEMRRRAWEILGRPEICGEPDFECTGCISAEDCEILRVDVSNSQKGQRKVCACLGNKHELLKNRSRCPHECIYCYWK